MGDRYRYSSGRRSPTFNPGRMSLPTLSSGYSSFYGGDIHVMPSSRYESAIQQQSHHHHRHGSNDWRGPNVPVTTTTYTVRKDPVTRSSSIREHSRTRSSTMDSTTKRPPIIVTTRQAKEPSSSHTTTSHVLASPAPDRGRDAYRSSDEDQYYTQPASSMRSRSHTRPYHASGSISSTLDNDEFLRLRQRTNDDRLAPTRNGHRRERPPSIYADPPRLSTKTLDLGSDTGYEYTKPSDLARYDLENDKVHTRRRRDSLDRNSYYRPSVNVSTDASRPYEGRARAPPPSRALDNYNRRIAEDNTAGIYDRPSVRMPAAAAVIPAPVPDRRSTQMEVQPSPVERADRERRPSRTGHRPVSLYQDGPTRASQPDDLYRTRDEGYASRDHRDRDYSRDDGVGTRGFGVRVDGDKKDERVRDREREEFPPARDRRTEQRRDARVDEWEREPKRRSDDDLTRREARKYSRDQVRKEDDHRADRKASKDDYIRGEDDRVRDRERDRERERERERDRDKDKDKDKIRDKVATGLSIAAGALGLGAMAHKGKDEEDKERSPKRRADEEARKDENEERQKPPRKEPEERPVPRDEAEERPRREREVDDADDKERNRRETEARLSGEPTMSGARDGSSSDEGKPRSRRRPSSAFRPNDTAGLMALKEQLKAKEESDKDKEDEKAASEEHSPDRQSQPSPSRRGADASEDTRGLETATGGEEKRARVVSPPRDKDDKKPIKGILKQPKAQFPEEPNPVREGVAPHKDDKSKTNVPPGARWTKISRKLVNPDALTIGKERFEVRDDFVIVLRVLNKEEIEAYTAATAQLREMKRQELAREAERDGDDRYDDDDDDDRRRPHRSHRRDPRDEEEDEKKRREEKLQRDRDSRSKRYRNEDDEEPRRLEYYADESDRPGLPHRSHRHREREREREREKVPVSARLE